jgi:Uma2 family endonuclease
MLTVLQEKGEERVLLHDFTWDAYEALLKTWNRTRMRLTFDRGSLEIMSPLLSHEQYGALIGQLIEMFTLEKGIPRHSGGLTTFKHKVKQRGLEPDRCYWIQNERLMRSRKVYNPERDPPPDLAIEVEITHSPLDRMSIYATLGVPEVWRFDGTSLSIHVLTAESGEYEAREVSVALPPLLPAVVEHFLAMSDETGEVEMMTAFLEWVRSGAGAIPPRPARKPPRRSRRKSGGSRGT